MLNERGTRLVKESFGCEAKIAPRQYAVGNDGAADSVIGRTRYKLEWNRGIIPPPLRKQRRFIFSKKW